MRQILQVNLIVILLILRTHGKLVGNGKGLTGRSSVPQAICGKFSFCQIVFLSSEQGQISVT